MQINVLSVAVSHKPGKGGGYKVAEVAYKDEQGKVQGKKVMSFINQPVFNVISEAKQGDVFDVVSEKDDNGYWQWTSINKSTASVTTEALKQTGNVSPKSTYETPEERAKKQVFIIKQSSLANAIALLAANGGKKNTPKEVIAVAKEFEAYVFDLEFDDGSINTIPNDIPE